MSLAGRYVCLEVKISSHRAAKTVISTTALEVRFIVLVTLMETVVETLIMDDERLRVEMGECVKDSYCNSTGFLL